MPDDSSAFPWVPVMRWQQQNSGDRTLYRVTVECPTSTVTRSVNSGWRRSPREAWESLCNALDWWTDAARRAPRSDGTQSA